MKRLSATLCTAAALLLAVPGALAQLPPEGTLVRPRDGGEAPTVIPERFLRRWDPITVFFAGPVGRAPGSPEHHLERFVRIEPEHPVAAQWIDPSTLQIKPVDPWRPLARYTVTAGGRTVRLATLLPAPTGSDPRDGAQGLPPVDRITLAFPAPLRAEALERMVSIELRPLPGAGGDAVRWITSSGFAFKPLEDTRDGHRYAILLDPPIPGATAATVHLRLSLDDTAQRSFARIHFSTMPPFRVAEVGTPRALLPVTPEGSRYRRDQALDGGSERVLLVRFTAPPSAMGPMEARRLVRLTPPVEDLAAHLVGKELRLEGSFTADTLYHVRLQPVPLTDTHGRPLEMTGPSELYLWFRPEPPYLRWKTSQGIVERFGPRTVPVTGRGRERLDIRLYPVDPLDRGFWPFPADPVAVDESGRPPGPGEEPGPHQEAERVTGDELAWRIRALGSPPVSTILDLPLKRGGTAAAFGLDVGPLLDRLRPPGSPGHYLLGLRALDAGTERQWMRVQATDLALTTVEEPDRVTFLVTSLAEARPVAGAGIRIEGPCSGTWTTLFSATTDAGGRAVLEPVSRPECSMGRITVTSGDDMLVLDPDDPPERFHDGTWFDDGGWLAGLLFGPETFAREHHVAHLRTERPVYRPGETVHILGYVRWRRNGRLQAPRLRRPALVVSGPGEMEWRYPVTLDPVSGFSLDFAEEDLPTGRYTAHLEGLESDDTVWTSSQVSFRMEAYRIPRFEVILNAPDAAPLDAPFQVSLTARYYAGGRAEGLPVAWRVTQFPLDWSPPAMEGFLFSSDARYSGRAEFESTGLLERRDVTDAEGGAVLSIDPTIEPTAAPRTYVVEATVTGADDQTVTSTRSVRALPPFVLGVAAPRFLEPGEPLEPRVVVLDPDGTPLPGRRVTVELIERQWHSYLRAGDFSSGAARYVTDVVEETVSTTTVTSGDGPLPVPLSLPHSGVYVVRLTARDRLGRAQTVAVDLYAAGTQPVGWEKPPEKTLRVSTDRDRYRPGETAVLVVQSPFQRAGVLAVVESPSGSTTHWLSVEGGTATFELPVEPGWAPAVPVHFVLMRGRPEGTGPVPGTAIDLGKPTTLAATTWLQVEPEDSRAVLTLKAPRTALPGSTVELQLELADPQGNPLSGRAAVWLVDRAVLALGKERPLDPLSSLVEPMISQADIRDTRNLAFGWIPFRENPGGGEGAREAGLLERVTVRRNFKPVAFFDPSVEIGADGRATVTVHLPDNLTDWAIRAMAADDSLARLGSARGILSVRLPVIVQPAMPRFVRSEDRFTAGAVARVVEGPGGPGRAEIAAPGLELEGPATRPLELVPNRPLRIQVPVTVPEPDPGATGPTATFRVAVERLSDGASDAFEVKLPVLPDRAPSVRSTVHTLEPGATVELAPVPGDPRPGSLERRLVVSTHAGVVKMAAALDTLRRYPHGCTEQRLARARAFLAARRFRRLLALADGTRGLKRAVEQTLAWLPQVVDDAGFAAYWPGSGADVTLTAWSVMFMAEARDAGYAVDTGLLRRMEAALQRALRSDAAQLHAGLAYTERSWALAALARVGSVDRSYAAELARRARFLDLEAASLVAWTLAGHPGLVDRSALATLLARIEDGVLTRLQDGREVYRGLDDRFLVTGPLILPSETRTLAEMARAVHRADPGARKLPLMIEALVRLGSGHGWGSTNADAAAVTALAELLQGGGAGGTRTITVESAGGTRLVVLSAEDPVAVVRLDQPGTIRLHADAGEGPVAVMDRCRWTPAPPGFQAEREAHGFVVTREALLVSPEAGVPPRRVPLEKPGVSLELRVGRVVEDHVRVVNPEERHFVAVTLPLAAGMEPLNPDLATAPPEARPDGRPTLEPSYTAFLDDRVVFFYVTLPAGSFDLYLRSRAATPGRFTQPAALAEAMYDASVSGSGNGALVVVRPAGEEEAEPR